MGQYGTCQNCGRDIEMIIYRNTKGCSGRCTEKLEEISKRKVQTPGRTNTAEDDSPRPNPISHNGGNLNFDGPLL